MMQPYRPDDGGGGDDDDKTETDGGGGGNGNRAGHHHSNSSPRSSSFNVHSEEVDTADQRISFDGHSRHHFQHQAGRDCMKKKQPKEEYPIPFTHHHHNTKKHSQQNGSSFLSSNPTSVSSSFQETFLSRERSLPFPSSGFVASSVATSSASSSSKRKSYHTTTNTSTIRKQRLLPEYFQPSPYSVIVGRSKEHKGCTGNLRLRELAKSYVSKYATAKLKIEKSLVVTDLITTIENACRRPTTTTATTTTTEDTKVTNPSDVQGGCYGEDVAVSGTAAIGAFIRFDQGRWWEVDDNTAREKVGYVLRELMTEQGLHTYKSSSKAKTASRRRRKRSSSAGDTVTTVHHRSFSSPIMAPAEGSMDVFDRPIFPVNTTTMSLTSSRPPILDAEKNTSSKTLDDPDGDLGSNISSKNKPAHYEES